ncbi:glycosylphosphatidylinositol anchor attachment 1 protein [Pelomyxa schiedti]|nr:glycosylphosphatidylinositol anchor attachment 1 protein [Pelomyxa schiedti]
MRRILEAVWGRGSTRAASGFDDAKYTRKTNMLRRVASVLFACVVICVFLVSEEPPPRVPENQQQQQQQAAEPPSKVRLSVAGLFSWEPRETYMSENALNPGTAAVDQQSTSDAARLASRLTNSYVASLSVGNSVAGTTGGGPLFSDESDAAAKMVITELKALGIETHHFEYTQDIGGQLLKGESDPHKWNVVCGIIRAPKGDGKEALAITSHFDVGLHKKAKILPTSVSGVGLTLALASLLKQQKWLAKDIIFAIGDNKEAIGVWLEDYVERKSVGGKIQAALCLDFPPSQFFSRLQLIPYGISGQLPNLDLLNTLERLWNDDSITLLPVHHKIGNHTVAERSLQVVSNCWHGFLALVCPQFQTLFHFMSQQAIGVPTGDHSYFIKYHIEAVTLSIHPDSKARIQPVYFIRLVLGALRSLNNVLEPLHQSFYYYLLLSPNLYTSIGNYMIIICVLLAPLIFEILWHVFKGHPEWRLDIPASFSTLICAVLAHTVGLLIYVALRFLFQQTITWPIYVWLISMAIACLVAPVLMAFTVLIPGLKATSIPADPLEVPLTPLEQQNHHMHLFSFVVPCCFLMSLSLVNISFCAFAAVFLVPLAVFLAPMERGISTDTHPRKNRVLLLVKIVVAILTSPPVLIAFACTAAWWNFSTGFEEVLEALVYILRVAEQQHSLYNTLWVPFSLLVYLPLNLLLLSQLLVAFFFAPQQKRKLE